MPIKKTSRDRKARNERRPYVDLNIGRTRLTAPKRTAQRAKRAVRSAVTHVGTCCLTLVVVQLLARR